MFLQPWFEIKDTTFAEEMLAVQKAAKEILLKRGSMTVTMFADEQPAQDDEDGQDLGQHHQPFLHCQGADDWYQLGAEVEQHGDDHREQAGVGVQEGGQKGDEIIFLV